MIGDIRPDLRHGLGRPDAALAEFEKAAARSERHAVRPAMNSPDSAFKHDVDALPVRSQPCTWSAKARVRESITWVTPSRRSKSRFASDPAVAKISAPHRSGELDGGEADAAGSGVHKNPLARMKPGEAMQAVMRRQEGDGDAGCVLRTHAVGNAREERGGRDRLRRKARRREAEYPVADTKRIDSAADFDDDAGAFNADRRRRPRIHLQHGQHVAEIDPRRQHPQPDLVRLQSDMPSSGVSSTPSKLPGTDHGQPHIAVSHPVRRLLRRRQMTVAGAEPTAHAHADAMRGSRRCSSSASKRRPFTASSDGSRSIRRMPRSGCSSDALPAEAPEAGGARLEARDRFGARDVLRATRQHIGGRVPAAGRLAMALQQMEQRTGAGQIVPLEPACLASDRHVSCRATSNG